MIGLPAETRVWLASGATDMRRGFDGLALLVQEVLEAEAVSISAAQLGYLLEGIDWRFAERTWRPQAA
ncbi:MAG: hypothetical protein GEV13_23405, partial [Rhodospirillales bacterium]|nr:hypothetical protein [Rhodospirillales bacterium]